MLPPNSFGRDSRADFPSGRFRLVITDAGLKANDQMQSILTCVHLWGRKISPRGSVKPR